MKVWFTMQFEGFHYWPEAPGESSYLANLHRHVFHIKVWCEVKHTDRDIEFIAAKRALKDYLESSLFPHVNNLSCEDLCKAIYSIGRDSVGLPIVKISVSEDGENGAEEDFK